MNAENTRVPQNVSGMPRCHGKLLEKTPFFLRMPLIMNCEYELVSPNPTYPGTRVPGYDSTSHSGADIIILIVTGVINE
eukprot:2197290-Rhodomonas_salina.1